LKCGLVIANNPNLVANDYKLHVVINGVVTFGLISISDTQTFVTPLLLLIN
jgi:hypothetical protein